MFKIVRDQDCNWVVQIMSLDSTYVVEEIVFGNSLDAATYLHKLMEWVEN
jgi:hypothetical protein